MQTYQVRCSRCHRLKWPYLRENPGDSYACHLCLLGSPRQQAARKASRTRRTRQKSVAALQGAS